MPDFRDSTFLSCDGHTDIRVRRCVPEATPRAIVQIAHGIAEHVERYDEFASFLASKGFLVVANDHLGHGKSVKSEADLGFFGEKFGWDTVVDDIRKLYEQTKAEYSGLPYFLFGHSMGSFLTRTYLIKYPDGLTGAILSGTGQQPALILVGGKWMSAREVKKHGPRYKSELLNNMAFGSYNKAFEPKRTEHDWLSRDEAAVDKYEADPLCGFIPSAQLLNDMMGGIAYNQDRKNVRRMNPSLPVYFMSGDKDPVGAEGKGVRQAAMSFRNAGIKDVTVRLYTNGRHEMLNEINRYEVFQDILKWLESKL